MPKLKKPISYIMDDLWRQLDGAYNYYSITFAPGTIKTPFGCHAIYQNTVAYLGAALFIPFEAIKVATRQQLGRDQYDDSGYDINADLSAYKAALQALQAVVDPLRITDEGAPGAQTPLGSADQTAVDNAIQAVIDTFDTTPWQ